MAALPGGTVTLLFSDIEGSTQLVRRLGERYAELQEEHQRLLRDAFARHNGHEVDTQGDSFFVVFSRAADAVAAAVEAQRALAVHPWPGEQPLRVRMALRTGEPARTQSGYVGMDVHHAARLVFAAHGGQVLLSQSTCDLVREQLPPGVTLRGLGEHRLRDLTHPEPICQLVIPGLPDAFPPLDSISNRPNNLPAQLTPLIGREEEVRALTRLLREDGVRLVTLTGPGGTGKTRLALQAATELLDVHDGVFLVPLAAVRDPAMIAPAIAAALGLAEIPGRAPLDTLKEHLCNKRYLLALDNFEQLVTAAPFLSEVLTACPSSKMLVTSRTVLHLTGEREFAVPPLSVPPRRSSTSPGALCQFAAVRLFLERAQAVRPGFVLTEANGPSVAEICRRLDGLPLAIELVAARARLLPPQAMLSRLEAHGLGMVTGSLRDMPERQRTLRAAIRWSYDLLADAERILFRRLAVFAGGCTLEAAEAVTGMGEWESGRVEERETGGTGEQENGRAGKTSSTHPLSDSPTLPSAPPLSRSPAPPALDVFEGVASLVDNSLLYGQERDGEPRFAMLEMVREFAQECLAGAGEELALRRRHAEFFLDLAEAAYPQLLGSPEQACWIDRLDREHDNLRAALSWLVDTDPSLGLRLAVALARFWRTIRLECELRESLARALERGAGAPVEIRIVALREMGEALQRTQSPGHQRRSGELLEESAALSRQAGDLKNLGWTLRKLGEWAQYGAGDLDRARAYFEESLAIERDRGDRVATGTALRYTGSVARAQGDLATARARYEESAALFRETGSTYQLYRTLVHLAAVAYMQGDIRLARSQLQQALPVFREMKDTAALVWALRYLGEVALGRGDTETARDLNEEYRRVSREEEDDEGVFRALWGLAEVARSEGRYEEARSLLREAAPVARQQCNKDCLRALLESMAQMTAARGQWERAARLFGMVEARSDGALGSAAPELRAVNDAAVARTLAALGGDAFRSAWEEGRALTHSQAVSYALEEEQVS